MAELSGAQIVAKSLKTQGVAEVFGIVGLPVGPVAKAVIDEDIRFVGTRHEQAGRLRRPGGLLPARAHQCGAGGLRVRA